MAKALFLFLALTFSSFRLADENRSAWLVWNVGQGQWVTRVGGSSCLHFDMGGEFASWSRIAAWCGRMRNQIFLSHWDWDHIGFVGRSRQMLPDSCVFENPQGYASPRKLKMLSKISKCETARNFTFWQRENHAQKRTRNSNAESRVVLHEGFLLTGDSTRAEEKFWREEIAHLEIAEWLMVGHHGSRTSTSKETLAKLTHLKLAIISAREKRYGHPHPLVMRDLREGNVPVLKTEDWGDIAIW